MIFVLISLGCLDGLLLHSLLEHLQRSLRFCSVVSSDTERLAG
jgi:hypothetical protein